MMTGIAEQIEPHIPALRRYAYALTRDHAFCDDLVQDCLERALSRWYLRRWDGDLRAWLFTILHNLFINAVRTERRRGGFLPLDEEEAAVHGGEQESALIRRDLVAAMQALSADQRSVLLLVGVEGMSYEAVSRVLNVPIGTVMSRLSRGRDQLRRLMDGDRAPVLRRVK